MNMKKPLALLLAAGLSLGLAACGNGSQGSTETPAAGGNTPSGDQTAITIWTYPIGKFGDKESVDALIAKFNEGGVLFDEAHPRYRAAALAALDRLAGEGVAFEVNTGAVAKGWRTQPYPANWLLEELQARGARLIFSSDCHKADQLLAGWQEWGSLCGPSL